MRLRGGGLGSSDEDSVSNVINVRSEEAMSEGGRHDDETDEGRSGMEGDNSSDSFEPVSVTMNPAVEGQRFTPTTKKVFSMEVKTPT